jgi:hypothetical protein
MSTPANSVNQNSTTPGLWTWDGSSLTGSTGLVQYNTLVGASNKTIQNISPGTADQIFTSNGATSYPSFQTKNFVTDSGSATFSSSVLNFTGDGALISTTGTGNNIKTSFNGGLQSTTTTGGPLSSGQATGVSGFILNTGTYLIVFSGIFTYIALSPVCTILECSLSTAGNTRGTVPANGAQSVDTPTSSAGVSITFSTVIVVVGSATYYPTVYGVFSGGNIDYSTVTKVTRIA